MLSHYKEKITPVVTSLILILLLLLYKFNNSKLIIASAVIIFLIIYIKNPKNNLHLNRSDIFINFLLLGFSTSYNITKWINGSIELERGILGILSIQIFYLLGHYSFHFFKQKGNELRIIMPVIFIALGFSVCLFSFTLMESIETKSFFISSRNVGGVLATVVAIYTSMGIALLPLGVKLLQFPNKSKLNILLISTIFFMVTTGLSTAIMLSNRSTVLILLIIICLLLFYNLYLNYKENRTSWIKHILPISILFITAYLLFTDNVSFLDQFEIPLLKRFAKNNLGETRTDLWWIGIKHLSTNFWGGKTYPLITPNQTFNPFSYLGYQAIYYAPMTYRFPFIHNLWLDVHYEAGMLPFCFLITFHLAHIKSLLSLILNTKRQIIASTVLGIVTVTFFYFMIEPAITASYNFFLASCFLLAYFRQIQTNSIKHYCKI